MRQIHIEVDGPGLYEVDVVNADHQDQPVGVPAIRSFRQEHSVNAGTSLAAGVPDEWPSIRYRVRRKGGDWSAWESLPRI
jgi:hypothetical protein